MKLYFFLRVWARILYKSLVWGMIQKKGKKLFHWTKDIYSRPRIYILYKSLIEPIYQQIQGMYRTHFGVIGWFSCEFKAFQTLSKLMILLFSGQSWPPLHQTPIYIIHVCIHYPPPLFPLKKRQTTQSLSLKIEGIIIFISMWYCNNYMWKDGSWAGRGIKKCICTNMYLFHQYYVYQAMNW